jgi:hypothetical protein
MEKKSDLWDFVKWVVPVVLAINSCQLSQLQHRETQEDRNRKHITVVPKGNDVEVTIQQLDPSGIRLSNTITMPASEWKFALGIIRHVEEEKAAKKGR